MSPNAVAYVLWLVTSATVAPVECSTTATDALSSAARDARAGNVRAIVDPLRAATAQEPTCVALSIAAWSVRGWIGALDAASLGGTDEALADVRQATTVLSGLDSPRSASAYAAAILHAAAAAAQDERDEMTLWLDHARDVAARLTASGHAPLWPLPFDVAEGELWLGVDDYELAELAYARALALEDSAAAWFGLARARDGRGERAAACEAYRRVDRMGPVAPDVVAATARALQQCRL